MLGHRRLNFFRYFVSNDLNINYLLCNLNRYVVDYWILYYAYLSPHKYENSSEILRALESKAPPISLRTYYARREEAIELLSSVLWGYIPIE